jgi:hypothetical protein
LGGAGTVHIRNRTIFYGNTAPTGANLHLPNSIVKVFFPLAPGHWLPNSECKVYREPCPVTDLGCLRDFRNCSLLPDNITDTGSTWSTLTPTGCQPRTFVQPCNWMTDPSLLTDPPTKVYAAPAGIDIEEVFPYECAEGVLGSSEEEYQLSSVCKQRCPPGYVCPTRATTSAQRCAQGSFCPEGSSAPIPCPAGTTANTSLVVMASVNDCVPCSPGFWYAVMSNGGP